MNEENAIPATSIIIVSKVNSIYKKMSPGWQWQPSKQTLRLFERMPPTLIE
jgi:hypothetical protein